MARRLDRPGRAGDQRRPVPVGPAASRSITPAITALGRRRPRCAAPTNCCELFGLARKADGTGLRTVRGMQRRLVLARALIHQPRLLILDEPTAGVDVELRSEIWRLVKGLNAAGTTILLTTHYLEEAETLCDEIALSRAGRIVDRGSAASLASPVRGAGHLRGLRPGDCRGGRLVTSTDAAGASGRTTSPFTRRAGAVPVAGRAGGAAVPRTSGSTRSSVRCCRRSCSSSCSARRWAGTSTPSTGSRTASSSLPGLFAQAILTVGFFNGTTSLFEARQRQVHQRRVRQSAAVVGDQRGPGDRGRRPRDHRWCRRHWPSRCRSPTPAGWSGPFVFGFGTLGVLVVAAQIGVIAGSLAKSLDHVYSMESIIVLPLGVPRRRLLLRRTAAATVGTWLSRIRTRSSGLCRSSGSALLGHGDVERRVCADRGVGACASPLGLVGGHLRQSGRLKA